MTDVLRLILAILASLFKSRAELEAENLVLRQQINVLSRRMPKRPALTNVDRLVFVWLYRWFPSTIGALAIVRPETIIRWHRVGFRAYWRWRSRNRVGRPKVSAELRALIGEMSRANPLWGAPRIHGELLKLGFELAQSTVAKYMVRRRGPPSQGWRTFLCNHAPHTTAIDMFIVPTVGFRLLYGLAIIRLERRHLVWTNVTANHRPTDHRGLPLGSGAPVPHSGQRRLVWPCCSATSCGHGNSGSTNCAAVALAEWSCRKADRFDPARVPGPRRGPGRSAPAPDPGRVCQLLQRTQDPPISGQRHPSSSSSRAPRRCHITTNPRRPSPPVLQNLIFGTHSRQFGMALVEKIFPIGEVVPGASFPCTRDRNSRQS
jgi:hypothetical protein